MVEQVRAALVDNTTLTAIQRLLGQIRTGNLHNIEGDILAFENFAQSMLLFDRVCTVDDYKPEYSEQRKSFFNFIDFLNLDDRYYSSLKNLSKSHGETLQLDLKGKNQLNTKLQEILSLIDVQFVGAWRMSGSDFFLFLEILTEGRHGDEWKYGPITAAFRSQDYSIEGARDREAATSDCRVRHSNGKNALVDESGTKTGKFAVNGDLYRTVSHINWMSYRSYFYMALASNEGLTLNLHPIRHAFIAGFAKQNAVSTDVGQRIFERIKDESSQALMNINEVTGPEVFRADFPMFSAWIAANSRTSNDFIPTLMSLRDHSSLKKLRTKLDEIELLRIEGDIENYKRWANKMHGELRRTIEETKAQFGVVTNQGMPTSPFVAAANIPLAFAGFSLPDPKLNIPKPRWFLEAKYRYSYRAFLRNMITDLGTVGSLGALYEKLKSGVRETKDAIHSKVVFHPKGVKNSSWKILLD